MIDIGEAFTELGELVAKEAAGDSPEAIKEAFTVAATALYVGALIERLDALTAAVEWVAGELHAERTGEEPPDHPREET